MKLDNHFSDNLIKLRHCFPFEYLDRHAMGSFLCVLEEILSEKVISESKIKECKTILKKRVGLSTAFRDYLMLPVTLLMSFSDNPVEYLEGLIKTFNKVKATYFTGSGQRLMVAMIIYENTPVDQVDEMLSLAYSLYEDMKKNHPILTGQEDMVFAALLAIDGEDIDSLSIEIEECFEILHKKFKLNSSPIQNVSHILAMTDIDNTEKSEKYIQLYEELKDGRMKRLGNASLLILLAVLSVLDVSVTNAVSDIKKMEKNLKVLKGFGPLGTVGIYDRRMIAVALIIIRYLPEEDEIHDVKTDLLKTIIRSVMIGSITNAKSSLAMSAHR